jgi:hypothetical protein
VVALAFAAGCNGGGSESPSTSSDHGGYAGDLADRYDSAYATCYKKMKDLEESSPMPDRRAILASVLLQPGDRHFRKVMAKGCLAGANAAIGVSGSFGPLYETTSNP